MEGIYTEKVTLRMPTVERIKANTPNGFFLDLFPQQTETWGPAFLEATYIDADGLTRNSPCEINTDFFASILGGDERLGHQTVYYAPEKSFNFHDYSERAFLPVAESKLKLLLSNYLLRCSQACNSLTDIENLVVKFREEKVLKLIVEKARTVLEVETGYFKGKHGKRRKVDGRVIEPEETPSYVQFVQKSIVKDPDAKLTIGDAFHSYWKWCKTEKQKPLTRQEFKHLVAEVIREEFRIGLRHDVLNDEGRQNHGWLGIDCRLPSMN
ncbi:MAG: hypothetical protein WCI55_17335 [Armatimonadota bacterium]